MSLPLTGAGLATPAEVLPQLLSGVIAADGETLTLVFNKPVTTSGMAFILTASLQGGSTLELTNGDGTATWTYHINNFAVFTTETITVTHDTGDPIFSDPVYDLSDNELANVIDFSVTNNSTIPEPP